jgi:two-component system, NarL family, response regulator NreC
MEFNAQRILIADDHESVLRRVRAIIESQPGWQVCGDAVTGRDAVARAIELKPDLVVLDFAMPGLDGLKAALAIKTVLPELPIVMFTHVLFCRDARSRKARNHPGHR